MSNPVFTPLIPTIFMHQRVARYLYFFACALMAASVLYLLAANWFMLPEMVKLGIPQVCLLLSATASVSISQHAVYRQALDGFSALMLGLSLAVIGQTYQTGADSYLLFVLWSGLLLPWLLRDNIAVFVFFAITTQLALYLYFRQSYLFEDASYVYLICLNILLGACCIWSLHQYPSLRFLVVAALSFMSVICMLNYVFRVYTVNTSYLISALVLPVAFLLYFYRAKQTLETSFMVVAVASSLSIWFLVKNEVLWKSEMGVVILATLLFMAFAAISFALTRLFPESKFSVMPLALGAWLSGIILSTVVLVFNESLSIVVGSMFILVAWFLFKLKSSFFWRQLAYCLWICGQTALLAYSYVLTENMFVVFLLQIVIVALVISAKMHWFKVTLQMLLLYICAVVAFIIEDHRPIFLIDAFNALLILSACLTASYWQRSSYVYSIALGLICIFMLPAILGPLHLFQGDASQLAHVQAWLVLSRYVLPVLVVLVFLSQRTQVLNAKLLIGIGLLGFSLIYWGYFEIFVMLMLLAWATVNRYPWIQALAAFALLFWLWMWYYQLDLTFLLKSLSIFISGCVVFAMAYGLQRLMTAEEQGDVR